MSEKKALCDEEDIRIAPFVLIRFADKSSLLVRNYIQSVKKKDSKHEIFFNLNKKMYKLHRFRVLN